MRNLRLPLLFLILVLACICLLAASAWATAIPRRAEILFGPASPSLSNLDRFRLAWTLVENVDALTLPVDPNGTVVNFEIGQGEPATSVITRLGEAQLIRDTGIFRDYLIYSGADTRLVPGSYNLSPAMTPLDIAALIQNIEATGLSFRILPGWRMEEIAAALPSSGLGITPEDFLAAVEASPTGGVSAYWPFEASHEGLLYPDVYIFPRSLEADALVGILTEHFRNQINEDILNGFSEQDLTVYEAVTLASIVQREAVIAEEMPTIASVFLNRLSIGMKLDADPTVQYALGYDPAWGWWKAPLFLPDLQINSAYNTYIYPGLPPGDIANPGIEALLAVAFPDETGFYYFRAACDGSGLHDFSFTFEEHAAKSCE